MWLSFVSEILSSQWLSLHQSVSSGSLSQKDYGFLFWLLSFKPPYKILALIKLLKNGKLTWRNFLLQNLDTPPESACFCFSLFRVFRLLLFFPFWILSRVYSCYLREGWYDRSIVLTEPYWNYFLVIPINSLWELCLLLGRHGSRLSWNMCCLE